MIYLVSCVKGKLTGPATARELYQSIWFRAARAFVEKRNAQWFILSALHGLVSPEQIVKPYETTLNNFTADERRFWAKLVAAQMSKQLTVGPVAFLAGKNYREFLIPLIEAKGFTWEAPLARLGIGSQVSWLQKNARSEQTLQV